ncbi:MAG TPA: glycosyltransferase family 39 protein [Flavilitoribacter sp.]|nr:glycosyltransferase family 39 protein [Flavilitoribacter sp.]HMQ90762.1 glycosyltransferase family 39 protein [Flavilitoribacter sp.]
MRIIETSFSNEQLTILVPSVLLILTSIFFYSANKTRTAVGLLLIGAFGIRWLMIILDPFLNEWDERYHALVAKNMMDHPFVPTLWREAILPYNYKEWCCNHIWLHKQPLFLWQMALSMKIFGVNEIAVRIPSMLLNGLQVLLTYRIGVLVHNKNLGYIAALMSALSYFGLEQVSGYMGRDHNEVIFFFYLTASYWSMAEYITKPRPVFLILIGVFSGMAILNKWLVGLLVFAGWFIGELINRKAFWSKVKKMILAGLISVVVFLPWQIYIALRFPKESQAEYAFNRKHIFEVLEGHSGDWLFYFKYNYILYGEWSWILILGGAVAFLFLVRNRVLKYAVLSSIVIIYLFFMMAKTKFISYVYVSSLVFLLMAAALVFLEQKLYQLNISTALKRASVIFALILVGFFTFRHWRIESYHARNKPNYFGHGPERVNRIHDAEILRSLKNKISTDYVILNTTQPIEVMFYTGNIAYFWCGPEDYYQLKKEHRPIAALKNANYPIPPYLEKDTSVLIMDLGLRN